MATSDSPLSVPNVTLAVARGSGAASSGVAEGVAGAIADGESITVASDGVNGFGLSTPTTEFFSDFSEIPIGTRLDASTPTAGSFYGTSPNLVSEAYSHSGAKSYEGVARGGYGISRIALPNSPNVISVSYWTFVPSGKSIPGYVADTFTIKDGVSPSSWKVAWLSTGDSSGNPDFGAGDGGDLCIPTNNGTDQLAIQGNSGSALGFYTNMSYVALSTIMSYGEWLWTSILIDPDNAGILKVRHMSKTKGFFEWTDVIDGTFWGASASKSWKFLNLPGYARTTDGAIVDSEVHHDDVVVQGGSAAGFSVLIGDAATLAGCTELQTSIKINSVTDSSCSVTLGQSPFPSYSGKYLFVTDAQGNPVQYNGSDSRVIS